MRNNTNRGRREKGFAVLLTTLTMFVTIPLAGLAFDLGTCYLIRARLGVAVDAASLAAARALSQGADQPTQDASAKSAAQTYFSAHFQNGVWGAFNTQFAPPVVDDSSVPNYRSVTTSASTQAPLYFMRVLGQKSSTINVSARASRRDALVMVVLDRSSSMLYKWNGTQTACSAMIPDAAQFVSNFAQGRDMVGLIIFGSSIFVYPPTTSFNTADKNGNTITSLINSIQCGGNTNTSEAMNTAYAQIQSINSPNRANVIVLMTDGRPNGFKADYYPYVYSPTKCGVQNGRLVGVISEWAGGPFDTGTVAGVMSDTTTQASTSNEVPTPDGPGCQFYNSNNLTLVPNDVRSEPSSGKDFFGNSLTGPYSVENTNFPYNGAAPDLAIITSPRQIIIASTNAVDNQATLIRQDKFLYPAIYTIALEGNAANDPPDTRLLRKMANDPTMETDQDPLLQTFFQQQKGQTKGYFADSPDPSQLCSAFNTIADQIVLRLSQ